MQVSNYTFSKPSNRLSNLLKMKLRGFNLVTGSCPDQPDYSNTKYNLKLITVNK